MMQERLHSELDKVKLNLQMSNYADLRAQDAKMAEYLAAAFETVRESKFKEMEEEQKKQQAMADAARIEAMQDLERAPYMEAAAQKLSDRLEDVLPSSFKPAIDRLSSTKPVTLKRLVRYVLLASLLIADTRGGTVSADYYARVWERRMMWVLGYTRVKEDRYRGRTPDDFGITATESAEARWLGTQAKLATPKVGGTSYYTLGCITPNA